MFVNYEHDQISSKILVKAYFLISLLIKQPCSVKQYWHGFFCHEFMNNHKLYNHKFNFFCWLQLVTKNIWKHILLFYTTWLFRWYFNIQMLIHNLWTQFRLLVLSFIREIKPIFLFVRNIIIYHKDVHALAFGCVRFQFISVRSFVIWNAFR